MDSIYYQKKKKFKKFDIKPKNVKKSRAENFETNKKKHGLKLFRMTYSMWHTVMLCIILWLKIKMQQGK